MHFACVPKFMSGFSLQAMRDQKDTLYMHDILKAQLKGQELFREGHNCYPDASV